MADFRLFLELLQRYQEDFAARAPWLLWLGGAIVLTLSAFVPEARLPGGQNTVRWTRRALTVALAAYAVHAGYQLRWVGDDAFISFRYAKNLIEGHGLVFNPGERVEGYTNFLWTVLIAGAMACGADPITAAIVLSLASLATLVALVTWLSVRLAPSGSTVLVSFAAVVSAGSYLLANFGTSGLETMFAATLGVAALVLACKGRWVGASTAAIAAAMSHPDHLLLWVCLGVALVTDPKVIRTPLQWLHDRARRRTLLAFLAPLALIFIPYFVARWAYYGDLFPNTYYAKSGNLFYFEQGGRYLLITLFAGGLFAAVPLAVAGALNRTADVAGRYFLAVLPIFTFYVAKVGGDFMLGRLLVPLLPLVFVFAEAACRDLLAQPKKAWRVAGGLAVLGFFLAALPVRVVRAGEKYWHVSDERSFYPLAAPSVDGIRSHYKRRAEELKRHVLRHGIDPLLGAGNVGVVGFLSGVRIVDILALADRNVAHMPITKRSRPGHEKIARGPYLLERQVDLSDDPIFPHPYSRLSEVRVGGSLFYMSGYKPDLVEAWKQDRAVRHLRFGSHLDRYVKDEGARPRLDCDVWFFDTFYFRHNADPRRSTALLERVVQERPELEGIAELLLPSKQPERFEARTVFDFEDLEGWERFGNAFRAAPTRSLVPDQGFVTGQRGAYVNSFLVGLEDRATGRLLSPEFELQGDALTVEVGGGEHGVHVGLLVDGNLVRRASGCNTEVLGRRVWDIRDLRGRRARVEVVDASGRGWGHVLADEVVQWTARP